MLQDTSTHYVVPVGGGTSPACTSGILNIVCLRDTVKRAINAGFSSDSSQAANTNVKRYVVPVVGPTSTACTSATVIIRYLRSMIKRTVDTSFSYLERDVEEASTCGSHIPIAHVVLGTRAC